jgi:hypothetical protein
MRARLVSFAAFLSVALIGVVGSTPQVQDSTELRAPSAFAGITEPQARSRALFAARHMWVGERSATNEFESSARSRAQYLPD